MSIYPQSFLSLVDSFAKFPGVGKRTAERFAFYLLLASEKESNQLASSIINLKKKIRFCKECFCLSDTEICAICSNEKRDKTKICVVENNNDMISIEKSGAYKGLYHILQGVLSPMDGICPKDIRIDELFHRIQTKNIKEIIIATNTTLEGDSTASYIASLFNGKDIKISRIASGVPIGGFLEYIDNITMRRAIEARNEI